MKKLVWVIGFCLVIGLISLIIGIMNHNVEKTNVTLESLSLYKVSMQEFESNMNIPGIVVKGEEDVYHLDTSKKDEYTVHVTKGESVEKGDLLITYIDRNLEFEEESLKLQRTSSLLEFNRLVKQRDEQERELEEMKKKNMDKDILATLSEEIEDTQYQINLKNIQLEENKLSENYAQERKEQLEIYSQSAGVVKQVNEGLFVTQDTNESIVTVQLEQSYSIVGRLTELQLPLIKEDSKVHISTRVIPGESWNGVIEEIQYTPLTWDEPVISENFSEYEFKASVEDEYGLVPGYHVDLDVLSKSHRMLLIPVSGMEKGIDYTTFVYAENDGKLERREISTGIVTGKFVEVAEGLEEGEYILEEIGNGNYEGMDVTR